VTVASLEARGGVRQHLLWLVLALSVALNLFFVAGALWIRFHGPPAPLSAEERLQRIGTQLDLSPQQRAAFEQYFQTVHSRMQEMREAVEPLMNQAWSELAKPGADGTNVTRLFDEAAEKRRGFRRELTASTLSFLATLSPEQRAKFVALARQRPWEQGHPHGSL
jgi:uncharacterized membrane protein